MNDSTADDKPGLAQEQPGEPDKAEPDIVTGLEEQITALKEQNLRYLAEMENTRRRAQKEREDAAKYAVSGFAKELLAVADNFERALAAAPAQDALSEAVKNLLAGIEATGRQLDAALERAGIRKIEAMGQVFDPNLHRVMMEIDDPNHPAGTVVQVMQTGYVIHDRLLREALVAVSKGAAPPQHVDKTA